MTPFHARAKAERCFAVARSTAFAGERDAAIARGSAIAERAGLSLDDFDVPGRHRPAPGPVRVHFARGQRRPTRDASDILDALARFNAGMAQAAKAAGAYRDETIYAARRRNFDAAAQAAAERDRQRAEKTATVQEALTALGHNGWTFQMVAPGRWAVLDPTKQRCDELGADDILALAKQAVSAAAQKDKRV